MKEKEDEWSLLWDEFSRKSGEGRFNDKMAEQFEIPDINAKDSVKRAKLFNRLKSYRYGDRKRSEYSGKKSICDYTPLEFKEAILNGKCEYCDDTSWNILGLDRLDNSLGHTKENTVLCCRICNSIKGNDYNNIDFRKMKQLGRIVKILKGLDLGDQEGTRILKIVGKNMYPNYKKKRKLRAENKQLTRKEVETNEKDLSPDWIQI